MAITVHVVNGLSGLARDARAVAAKANPELSKTVKRNVSQGEKVMKTIARGASGPHGKNYWKRIDSEMTGALSGAWGPHAGGLPVGAGWRHGENTDAPKSGDIQGPKFAKDVLDTADGLFWPGAG